MKKVPVRGDRVIDMSRVIKKEGVIISGVFEPKLVPPEGEIFKEAFVEFSPATTGWYSLEQLEDNWNEGANAFILNVEN